MSDDIQPETPDETPVEETTAPEQPVAETAPAAEEAPAAEPEVLLNPKERRQARRSAAVAKRGPRRARTQEERDAERKRKADQRRRYRAKQKAKAADKPKGETPEPAPKPTGQLKIAPGHRRLRQGRQDDHRPHRRRAPAPPLQEDDPVLEHAARP